MLRTPIPEHLPFLRLIAEDGGRPIEYSGSGKDRTIPAAVAKRLEGQGYIVQRGEFWVATARGRHAVGRV